MVIRKIMSSKIVLNKFDEIPFLHLLDPEIINELADRFHFRDVEIPQNSSGKNILRFVLGRYERGDKSLVIPALDIEDRKFVINIEGTSKDADAFHQELISFMVELTDESRPDFLDPVLVVHESEILSHLDIQFQSLLPDTLLEVMGSYEGEQNEGISRIKPVSIKFEVNYTPEDADWLDDYRISLTRKPILIEARPGYPLEERIYASKAPFDSDTHIQLLEDIEASLSS